jgi:colicin import membrane protein
MKLKILLITPIILFSQSLIASPVNENVLNVDKVIVQHNKQIKRLKRNHRFLLQEIKQLKERQNISDTKTKEIFHLLEYKKNDEIRLRKLDGKIDTLLKALNVEEDNDTELQKTLDATVVVRDKYKAKLKRLEKREIKLALEKVIFFNQQKDLEIAQEDFLNKMKVHYINRIAKKVKENWRYQGAKDNWSCDVYILQDIDGNVQSVNAQSCNVGNNAKAKSFKNAIERAVYKASPLPAAPNKSVFDREILFHFKVN